MAIQKTEAFILKTHPFRTSSLIVTAFSRTFGKIKGVAKGVRTEGAARPGAFEPFTLVELIFYEKHQSDLHLFSDVAVLETYEKLKQDLEVLATAYYVAELTDQLSQPHDPHEALFDLLHLIFEFLPSVPPVHLARLFEVRVLQEVGLFPHLEGCLGCGETRPEKIYFSQRQGAVYCGRCRQKSSDARASSLAVLEAMRSFMNPSVAEVLKNPLDPEVEKGIGDILEGFLTEKVGKRLVARRFLDQVRSLKAHRLTRRGPATSIHEAKENQNHNQHTNRHYLNHGL